MKFIFQHAVSALFFVFFGINNTTQAHVIFQNNDFQTLFIKAETQLYKDNNYTAAIATAKEGLKINSEHKALQTILALATYKSGNKPEGRKLFDALIEKHADDNTLKEQYAFLIEKDDAAKALSLYELVLMKDPSNLKALFYTGQHYATAATNMMNNAGSPQEVFSLMTKAIERFEKYHEINPKETTVTKSLIQYYENLRMTDKAEAMKKKL
jgi:tetratricopeptide (TPR) repeat protein